MSITEIEPGSYRSRIKHGRIENFRTKVYPVIVNPPANVPEPLSGSWPRTGTRFQVEAPMRFDLVILIMLVSWIGLGFTGAELKHLTEELNACNARVTQTTTELTTSQDEVNYLREDVNACQAELATAKDQVGNLLIDNDRINIELAACNYQLGDMATERDLLTVSLTACDEQLINAHSETVRFTQALTTCNQNQGNEHALAATKTYDPQVDMQVGEKVETSGWLNALAAIVATAALAIRQILTNLRRQACPSRNLIRVTEEERRMVIQFRRRNKRN